MLGDSEHTAFSEWAQSRGVRVYDVAPASFPGRGLGIVSRNPIEAGAVLMSVPAPVVVTAASAPADVSRAIGDITVHGLLAASLALDAQDDSSRWRQWRAMWPSKHDFRQSHPLLWDPKLQNLLPPAAKDILREQEQKLAQDFEAVSIPYPDVARQDYTYHWLIVNTRCFYYVRPGTKDKHSVPPNDRMALCPFMDYLNHAQSGLSAP